MPLLLTEIEARVLGSLIEKSLTTPDLYPLTLNALLSACNQKSSREPVMSLDEPTVARALASLREKNLAYTKSESGNRAPKFGHRVENLLQGGNAKEVGAMCVLLLRGPQTAGEIKTRTDRLCEFESVAEVAAVLDELAQRTGGPYVERLPRHAGQKEARYAQLFTAPAAPNSAFPRPAVPAVPLPQPASTRPSSTVTTALETRLAGLEARVKLLESAVGDLQKNIRAPNDT